MELTTNKGKKFIIDPEDYELIKNYNWVKNNYGYLVAYISSTKKYILMHRLIMNVLGESNTVIDHINGIQYDNRKSNLRKCTHAENMKNRKSSGSSKYLGVYLEKRRLIKRDEFGNRILYYGTPIIRANIKINGKNKNLGTFKTEEEAALAYNEIAKILHGEFARLNIISTGK